MNGAEIARGGGALPPLKGRQAAASDPATHVWLSASAGTGKTQVLAARVYRLLLRGVDPAAILCLTFTKAGAAEMAARISARLAAWVRMPSPDLSADLNALGERSTPALQARARTLFASVLDAPGGGVRIQTIHGFCQSLLAAFPVEAGLAPGFRPLEPREETALGREALAAMLEQAERDGRGAPIAAIGALSRRLGEGGAEGFLAACATSLVGLEALPPAIEPWLRRALGLPGGSVAEVLGERCAAIDVGLLDRLAAANRGWGTATGAGHADAIAAWLAADSEGRAATLATLAAVVLTGKGEPRKASAKLIAIEPDYEALASSLGGACSGALGVAARIGYADLLAAGLSVGRDYARAYAIAKRRAGAVDFDDLIDRAVELLERDGIGDWVRYKLDQTTEHILIDEAQDTNLAQWRIVAALAGEFFAGRGTHGAGRTIFTVGDYKQAIFGFQGTDPENFRQAEIAFRTRAEAARGDDGWPEAERGRPFERLSLTQSFRSTQPVLAFVDAALAALPAPGLGGIDAIEPHASEVPGSGSVSLWPPTLAGDVDEGEEDWADDAERRLASDVARSIRGWLDDGAMLGSKGRALRPDDVMILVRRRGTLASLIVARLYAEGVPVAGIDRLRLNAPLAVQDLLAAIRFVLQPDDDLSLASLLVSPLIGWSQDDLMTAATERGGLSLWRQLQLRQPDERLAPLLAMLARADFTTPHRFLEEMLSGPLDGRRKLIRRLGNEARDPIEELVSAALAFERAAPPSLQGFLDWFDRGDVEIVRDAAQPQGAVRVLTAHGAKGLQAPVVILADAAVDPTNAPRSLVRWSPEPGGAAIPVIRPRADERGGPLDAVIDAADTRDLEEHWRLFYVAATRAEERLVIAGALGPRAKGVPPPQSWYAAAAAAITALGVPEAEGPRVYEGGKAVPSKFGKAAASVVPFDPLPLWARQPAPVEARPPRPLAPSSMGDDAVADPPPTPAMREAAERGRLLHLLFERLPPVEPGRRREKAMRWLVAQGSTIESADLLAATVLAILEDGRFADYFVADALAEAPITATLPSGLVVAGTVDRLIVTPDRVRFVDFKSGRRVPTDIADVPGYHLRQLAAYAAALGVIFPDRPIEAALLYTAGPLLLIPPADLLAAEMERFASRAVEKPEARP